MLFQRDSSTGNCVFSDCDWSDSRATAATDKEAWREVEEWNEWEGGRKQKKVACPRPFAAANARATSMGAGRT